MFLKVFVLILSIIVLIGCIQSSRKGEDITMICVRDKDTIHLKINNNTADTIYIPERYIGTYNAGNDTIFLETIDKPKFNKDYFYLYKRQFPFEMYLSKKIQDLTPDSTIVIEYPTYYFNQFLVSPFSVVPPHSTHISSTVFYVPMGANICNVVYYKTPFFVGNKKPLTANYLLEDWVRFDSINAKYLTSEIADRIYFK
jgi:hypothetical protein